MSILNEHRATETVSTEGIEPVPCLVQGQRLDQRTFHELYLQMPEFFRAELIEGVVHVMNAAMKDPHSDRVAFMIWFLTSYAADTPGVSLSGDATVKLPPHDEVQPDTSLRIKPEYGGQTRYDDQGYRVVAPELVVEVASSTLAVDLGAKKDVYERSDALEYLVLDVTNQMIRWFTKVDGSFQPLKLEADRTFRSKVFPGLWLDEQAFFHEDHHAIPPVPPARAEPARTCGFRRPACAIPRKPALTVATATLEWSFRLGWKGVRQGRRYELDWKLGSAVP